MADPTQPPRYPVHPYPFPAYAPAAPRMPGLTVTAVVLLWVMVGLGALGALASAAIALLLPEPLEQVFPGLGSWMPLFMAVYALQSLTWAVLRSFVATGVQRRSARARNGAILVESVGLALQVAFALVLFSAFAAGPHQGSTRFNFDCTGIVLPILVLCFLSTARSRWWCDR